MSALTTSASQKHEQSTPGLHGIRFRGGFFIAGATYKAFFGSGWGLLYTTGILSVWAIWPLYAAIRVFRRKDC